MGAEPRLILHIGAMKTGTTYLQSRLAANAGRLEAQGWWVPEKWRSVNAVREGLGFIGPPDPPQPPRWPDLLRRARERGGAGTIVSMEFLSYARYRHFPELLAPAEGLDIRVILTVRDAVRALPSQWQSLARNRQSLSWPQFAEAVRNSREQRAPGTAQFRRTQDIPRILRTWAAQVPREHLTAVTVPGPGQPRDLLWERFLGVVGIDPATLPNPAMFDNPQLGYGACELLRLVNGAGLDAEDPDRYRTVVRRLTRDHLDQLREGPSKPRMDVPTARFAVGLNRRTLHAAGRHAVLVGEETDLPRRLDVHPLADGLEPGPLPPQVPEAEVRAAADVLHRGAVDLCREEGLALPAELSAPLPDDLPSVVDQVAAVLGVAMTGDITHRPTAGRPAEDASTVTTDD